MLDFFLVVNTNENLRQNEPSPKQQTAPNTAAAEKHTPMHARNQTKPRQGQGQREREDHKAKPVQQSQHGGEGAQHV